MLNLNYKLLTKLMKKLLKFNKMDNKLLKLMELY
jgi:hypothetical protein